MNQHTKCLGISRQTRDNFNFIPTSNLAILSFDNVICHSLQFYKEFMASIWLRVTTWGCFHKVPFAISVGGMEARLDRRILHPCPCHSWQLFGEGLSLFCFAFSSLNFAQLPFKDGFVFFFFLRFTFSPASPFTHAIISCLDHFPNTPPLQLANPSGLSFPPGNFSDPSLPRVFDFIASCDSPS